MGIEGFILIFVVEELMPHVRALYLRAILWAIVAVHLANWEDDTTEAA